MSPWSRVGRPSSRPKLERKTGGESFTRLDRLLIAERKASNEFADLRPDPSMGGRSPTQYTTHGKQITERIVGHSTALRGCLN
ncbi:hypothetical protein BRAO375_1270004 [Bradyrhizobium sp. ORS 375]|nr:hypothetical protein BRAO375_1270004 [Bradyrhizobium sp. ORS 375]